jgi:G3E family GTPase
MNIIIFGGFLGAGKTSMILSLAAFLVKKERHGTPPADLVIIENEIGETGIDDKVLKSGGYQVRELFAGCICCTLTADLAVMLNDISENIRPKWVIIECTGLAYPQNIVDSLKRYARGIENMKIITVVDSERWAELSEVCPILVEKQVSEGDILLINKTDLVDENELDHLEIQLKELNSDAKLFRLSATGAIISDSVWKEVIGSDE